MDTIVGLIAGAIVALAVQRWLTRNERSMQAKRAEFLRAMIQRADRYPGGREFFRCPYNEFVRGVWMEDVSQHYPRLKYKQTIGVHESA